MSQTKIQSTDEIGFGPKKSAIEVGTMSEGFRVVVRIRPPLGSETNGCHFKPALKVQEIQLPPTPTPNKKHMNLSCDTKTGSVSEILLLNGGFRFSGTKACFVFDQVFEADTTQDNVFKNSATPHLDTILKTGDNGTIFAYGQTGSGKTHTIIGDMQKINSDVGIIPRVMYDLFEWLSSNKEETHTKSIAVSFVHLAEGVISDLLSDDQKPVKKYFDPTTIVVLQ